MTRGVRGVDVQFEPVLDLHGAGVVRWLSLDDDRPCPSDNRVENVYRRVESPDPSAHVDAFPFDDGAVVVVQHARTEMFDPGIKGHDERHGRHTQKRAS
mgnify:CR=1 FL=1